MFRARGRKNIEKRALNRILPLHLHLPCSVCSFFFSSAFSRSSRCCLPLHLPPLDAAADARELFRRQQGRDSARGLGEGGECTVKPLVSVSVALVLILAKKVEGCNVF